MKRRIYNFKYILIFLIQIIAVSGLFAQSYSVKETKKGAFFFQRLEWESSGVVTQFKVIVEQYKNDRYVQIEEYITKDTWQEVSLDAGKYRFKVIFYNVFGQLAFETKYENFEILAAHQPVVKKTKKSSIYFDEESDVVCIPIEVQDINQSAKFYLEDTKDENATVTPLKVEFTDEGVLLYFNKEKLNAGKYNLVVKNPGGLKDDSKIITVKEKNVLYWDLSLSTDGLLFWGKNYVPYYIDSHLSPLGLSASGELLYKLNDSKAFGGQAKLSYNHKIRKLPGYKVNADFLRTELDGVYQYKLYDFDSAKLYADFTAGLGATMNYFGVKTDEDFDSIFSVLPYAELGLDVKYIFENNYYLLFGLDFICAPKIFGADYQIFASNIYAGGGIRLK